MSRPNTGHLAHHPPRTSHLAFNNLKSVAASRGALRALVPSACLTASDDDPLPIIVDELDEENFPITFIFMVDTETGIHSDPAGADCLARWRSEDWSESAPARAAKAYQRECRWDVPPGPDGVLAIAASPYRWIEVPSTASLVGFIIVHDRDDDDEYESVAHLWTATAWRRRGVAEQLLRTVRDLLPINTVEEPITSGGRAPLGSVAGDLLRTTRR